MVCRRYFAANRLEVLLDEDDSRSSSRARGRGSSSLVSQLHVAIQTLWSQCLFPRAERTNRLVVHSQVSPFLFDLRLRFRLRLCLFLHVQQTLAHNSGWTTVLEFLVPSRPNKTSFSDLLSKRTWWLLTHGSLRSWKLGFWFWLDLLGVSTISSNFWIQFFHPIIFKGNLWRRSRWRLSRYIKLGVCRKGWLRYIFFDRTSILSVEQNVYRPNIYRILVPFPLLLVRCKTWFGQVKLLRIFVIFIYGIHGCKEYCLSLLAQNLSFRYQSWICDGV